MSEDHETTVQPKPHWASLFGQSTHAKNADPLDVPALPCSCAVPIASKCAALPDRCGRCGSLHRS